MPYCPNCKYEYRPDIEICPDCNAELVAELPEEKEPEWVDLVEVASFPFEIQAQEARMLLESHKIPSVIKNEKMAQTDIILAFADGGVKVMVRREDYSEALKVLEGS